MIRAAPAGASTVSLPMVEPSWETLEKPILRAVVGAENRGDQDVNQAARSAVDVDDHLFMLTVDRLVRDGLIDALVVRSGNGEIVRISVHYSQPAALREVGLWPKADSLEALVDLFEALAAREPDAERKGRLQSMASGFRWLLAAGGDLGSVISGAVSVYGLA